MSAVDETERILRDLHILFSKAKPFDANGVNVVVNKNSVIGLLQQLNDAMFAMQEEYELTQDGREKAMRELQKRSDDMAFTAQRNAEDVYAASILYAEASLARMQSILDERRKAIESIYEDAIKQIDEEERVAKTRQIEMKSALTNAIDSQKYYRLINKENDRLARGEAIEPEEMSEELSQDQATYVAPEIKVNTAFLEANGYDVPEETTSSENRLSQSESDMEMAAQALSDDLDAEYFDWKDKEESNDKNKSKKGRKAGRLFSKS